MYKERAKLNMLSILFFFYDLSMSDTSALPTGTITVIIQDPTGKEL
jgi:hypothetical protein